MLENTEQKGEGLIWRDKGDAMRKWGQSWALKEVLGFTREGAVGSGHGPRRENDIACMKMWNKVQRLEPREQGAQSKQQGDTCGVQSTLKSDVIWRVMWATGEVLSKGVI